jgi:hypothetical protein
MKVSVIIDPAHDQHDTVRYDIQTFLHFQTRGYWTRHENAATRLSHVLSARNVPARSMPT